MDLLLGLGLLFVLTRAAPGTATTPTTATSSAPPSGGSGGFPALPPDAVKAAGEAAAAVVAAVGGPGAVGAVAGTAVAGGTVAAGAGTATGVGATAGTMLAGEGAGAAGAAVSGAEAAAAGAASEALAGVAIVLAPVVIGLIWKFVSEAQQAEKDLETKVRNAAVLSPADVCRYEHDFARAAIDADLSGVATKRRLRLLSGETVVDDPRLDVNLAYPIVHRGRRTVIAQPNEGTFADPYRWEELQQVARACAVELVRARSDRAHSLYVNWLGRPPLQMQGQDYAAVDEVPGIGGNLIDAGTRERVAGYMRSTSAPVLMARLRFQGIVEALRLMKDDTRLSIQGREDYVRDFVAAAFPSGLWQGLRLDGEWLYFAPAPFGLAVEVGIAPMRFKDNAPPFQVPA